jgi:hypothetical protein
MAHQARKCGDNMNLIFKVIIGWIFAFGVGSFVYLANADEQRTNRIIENPVQDGNLVMRINDGGTKRDAISIDGANNAVTLGTSATSARHFIINSLVGGYALEVENQNVTTGKGLRVYANNSSSGASDFALLVEGATGERMSVRNDGRVNVVGILSAGALQRTGANGVTFNESATIDLFSTSSNSAYIVNIGQQGVSAPIVLTCFIYIGSDVNTGTWNAIGSTGEMSCSVGSGQVRVTNTAGGVGNTTIRWGANTIY